MMCYKNHVERNVQQKFVINTFSKNIYRNKIKNQTGLVIRIRIGTEFFFSVLVYNYGFNVI